MFSQWATKRICKFFMKRLLGRMLRSELDLEQLEVQLGLGTIQLKELFLNTDYLNDQLGDSSLAIKEGSIGSIRAKIPWKVLTAEPCEIEVDELKLVIIPRFPSEDISTHDRMPSVSDDLRFVDTPQSLACDGDASGRGTAASNGAYIGVDDGVRMIAKMVERVLLGLRVKVTNMIIVLEEQINDVLQENVETLKPQHTMPPHTLLIARVAYVEYGVEAPHYVLEESAKSMSGTEPSMLVKVVKFRGATVEFIDVQSEVMEFTNQQTGADVPLVHFIGQPEFILVGESGGLTGSIQLSVLWKDGIIDVPKVHADFIIGPLKLILSPHQIQQLLNLTQAFNCGPSSRFTSSSGVTTLKSSIQNVGCIGNTAGGSQIPISADRDSEGLRPFCGSLSRVGGSGVEANSANTAFLPVSRFISDWMHWGGTDGQRKDGAVVEADLAASVDEFFECFDGTRSCQAGFSSSGMWNWTRSAFSAITAASSLAAGSIVLPPDPPKQPEYSMKAKLTGLSLDLYYHVTPTQNYSLVPTSANELFPLKDVSSKLSGDLGNQMIKDAKILEGDEHLKADLSELDLTLTVSGSQTKFSMTISDLDVSESVLKDVVKEEKTSGWQSSAENTIPITQILQSSIERVLPSFSATLSPCDSGVRRAHDSVANPANSNQEGEGPVASRQPAEMMARKGNYEKKQLLRVHSESEDAVQITVTSNCQSPENGGSTSVPMEMIAFLQPVVIWLDARTVKRIEHLMQKSTVDRKSNFTFDDTGQNPRVKRDIQEPGQRQGLNLANDGLISGKGNIVRRSLSRVKLYAPCVRVIICFPAGFGLSSTGLQSDFVVLDLNASTLNFGIAKPIVDFSLPEESKSLSSSSPGDTLTWHIEDIVATFISSVDENCQRNHVDKRFNFTTNEILLISQHDSVLGSLRNPDRQFKQGASVEFQWHSEAEVGSWMAKRVWDGVAAQQKQGDSGHGIGGSNSEFAAATTAAETLEEENSQLRKELLSYSSFVVRVNIPQLKFRISESQYARLLELIGCFMEALVDKNEETSAEKTLDGDDICQPSRASSDLIGLGSHQSETFQTSFLVQCGQVDIALDLKGQRRTREIPKQGTTMWDVIRLNLDRLQVLSVVGIGGSPGASYFWVHHEDTEVSGSFLIDCPTVPYEEPDMLLLSCKTEALGRGDGGGGNALAAGKAGLTITYVVWPGQEQLGDALLTGTVRGITFVAHSGRLDWLSAVTLFFNFHDQVEDSQETSYKSGLDDSTENDSELNSTISPAIMRTYFLLDFHDVALCYEPGSEATLVPGVRSGKDSLRQGTASSAETSQKLAPVACVVAAAAVRVSSSVVPRVKGEQYDIWLRDVALHILDTMLRKKTSFDYTTESMHHSGYVQIAKEAVMEAFVRIDGENSLRWEVECENNQLRFDTCHDTTAAFGRLVAQFQQLFTPEIDQSSINVNTWKLDGQHLGGETPSCSNKRTGFTGDVQYVGDTEDANSVNLFEGVLEDAFSRVRGSWSSAVGDNDVDELQGETYTVINAPLHSRVSSVDRHEFLERGKQDLSGLFNRSMPTTPTLLQCPTLSTPSEESVIVTNSGLPTFIEDYYMTTQKHAPHSLGNIVSKQMGDSPLQSTGPSRHASRESASPVAGREAEGKGGWYTGRVLEVLEDHVPKGSIRHNVGQPFHRFRLQHESQDQKTKVSLPKKYPSSVGRIILRDLCARWRLYGGSDWPMGRVGLDQKLPSQSNLEESGRQSGVCLEVFIDGMGLQYDSFPAVGLYASRLVVSIRDIAVYDFSSDAPWRKVLGYHRSKSRPRESSSQAVKIEMDSVRPDPSDPLEEYRLSIGLLPIRLHLDQRHIDFCIEFFSPRVSSAANGLSPEERPNAVSGVVVTGMVENPADANDLVEDALLPFFQICEIRPLTIRVDYVPRRVDLMSLRGGNYAELLNLVTWKGIELNLKNVRAAGVHGWSSLSGVIFGEWLEDISQNQVHKFVRGVGPIRPLYAVGSGAAKLLVLPAEHYKKDRRLFRGMRKGAIAFLRSISLEALGLGAHLAAGAHEILQQTEVVLGGSPIPTSSENGDRRSRAVQPGDTREGLQQACESISQGLERTALSLLGNPLKVYQRGAGAGLAVASALRAAPAAAVAPASAAAGAVHCALLGVRNELDPEKKRESDEKHTGPPLDTRRV